MLRFVVALVGLVFGIALIFLLLLFAMGIEPNAVTIQN